MEFDEVIRRRRMVRSFSSEGIDRAILDRILEAAMRSPSAGNTASTAWIVLEGPAQTGVYFDTTTDAAWRARNPERAEGLRRAPAVLLAYASPDTYLARYAERDKSASGLGADVAAWPVPYWFGDAAFGVMAVLLAAVDAGLGACVLGAFKGQDELATRLGVPPGWHLFAAVAVGQPDGHDHRSASLTRRPTPRSERVHRGLWQPSTPSS